MSQLNFEDIINILKEFVKEKNSPLELILVGGLALYYYGLKNRATIDLDAEVNSEIDILVEFLKTKGIPSDLGNDISKWSVISLPPGYRERTMTIYKDQYLKIKALHPIDFVIAKLRRYMEQDLEDALFVVKKFGISPKEIEDAGKKAIEASPKDTAIFVFKKNLKAFIDNLCAD